MNDEIIKTMFLKFVVPKLPRDAVKKVAKQLDVTTGIVNHVKYGLTFNLFIIEALTICAEENMRKEEEVLKRMARLVDKNN